MRLLLPLLALLLAAPPADAQRRYRDRDDGFARAGDFALTFGIDGLNLQPFAGGVGGRLWLTDRVVGAASLGFEFGREESRYGGDAEALGARLSFGVERHFGGSPRVSPFVGLGATIGAATFDVENVFYPPIYDPGPCVPEEPCPVPEPYPYPRPFPYTSEVTETTLGAAGFLGAEVRLAEGLTLSAAHSLGLTYSRTSTDDPPIYYDFRTCSGCEGGGRGDIPDGGFGADSDRVTFGTGTSQLTLSIYF